MIAGLTPNTMYAWEAKSVCAPSPIVSSNWSAEHFFTTAAFKMSDDPEVLFELYPNPVSQSFTIDVHVNASANQSATIFMLNELGQIIYSSHELIANGEFRKVIAMPSTATAGWYVVRVVTNSKVIEKKLMYQK